MSSSKLQDKFTGLQKIAARRETAGGRYRRALSFADGEEVRSFRRGKAGPGNPKMKQGSG
jgi:hypothetical protein